MFFYSMHITFRRVRKQGPAGIWDPCCIGLYAPDEEARKNVALAVSAIATRNGKSNGGAVTVRGRRVWKGRLRIGSRWRGNEWINRVTCDLDALTWRWSGIVPQDLPSLLLLFEERRGWSAFNATGKIHHPGRNMSAEEKWLHVEEAARELLIAAGYRGPGYEFQGVDTSSFMLRP